MAIPGPVRENLQILDLNELSREISDLVRSDKPPRTVRVEMLGDIISLFSNGEHYIDAKLQQHTFPNDVLKGLKRHVPDGYWISSLVCWYGNSNSAYFYLTRKPEPNPDIPNVNI